MKVTAQVPIYPGDGEIFGPDVARGLIDKKTTDGGKIVATKQTARDEIMLTVEFEISDDFWPYRDFNALSICLKNE